MWTRDRFTKMIIRMRGLSCTAPRIRLLRKARSAALPLRKTGVTRRLSSAAVGSLGNGAREKSDEDVTVVSAKSPEV